MAEQKYYGIYQGIVTNIEDPEKRGRVKAQIPDVLSSTTESAWIDPVVTVAYDLGGDFCLPQIKEAIWIAFIGGDPNKPVYFGGWWQKNMTPLGSDYSNLEDIRIIKYADCTIIMRNGVIKINVADGVCDLQIEDGKVSVLGDLRVTGNTLIEGTLDVTKQVTAASVSAYSDGSVKTNIIEADKIIVDELIGGSIDTTSGISLDNHVHGGVVSGGSNTTEPR